MEDILDDLTEPESPPDRKGVDKTILQYTIITALFYFFYAFTLKKILPFQLFNTIETESLVMGLSTIVICFFVVIKLNILAPTAEKLLFIIWGASAIFYGDLIYRIFFEFVIYQNFNQSALWFVVKISMIRSIMAGAVCYVIIHNVRDEDSFLPYLISAFVFVALYFLLQIVF